MKKADIIPRCFTGFRWDDVSQENSGGRTWDGELSLTLQELSVVLDELVRLFSQSVTGHAQR